LLERRSDPAESTRRIPGCRRQASSCQAQLVGEPSRALSENPGGRLEDLPPRFREGMLFGCDPRQQDAGKGRRRRRHSVTPRRLDYF
jgi:hypothetical protein